MITKYYYSKQCGNNRFYCSIIEALLDSTLERPIVYSKYAKAVETKPKPIILSNTHGFVSNDLFSMTPLTGNKANAAKMKVYIVIVNDEYLKLAALPKILYKP